MNETVDLNAYISYVVIAAYYVIMLRLWLPPPPSERCEEAGDDKAAVPDGMSSGASGRQIAPPRPGDNGQPSPSSKTVQPDEPLERIRAADEHFDESAFLSGASQAYELVVNAYAKGDMLKLNGLLDTHVAAAFCDALGERREKGEVLTLSFVGIRRLDIADAWLDADLVKITVRFVSELVTATHASDNTVIAGDPTRVVAVTDLWTFARRVPSNNPNWMIVGTAGP
ncbi:Tim44/TimA family putative adaptor protein [Aminobacter anthyllidis]|uniref:Tim44/TimA family putative adaptor protein n=1 Tax=Aminobacter anthyllidis TaxID=1035067 RepID=UPI002458E0F7|nr:Tim44/TimA family putative adaptor protein [Aminobacter anthyllidis]MDH4984940.1 Tim44/TimA family putative adaptor protein [Aminobacter anthyllidis]